MFESLRRFALICMVVVLPAALFFSYFLRNTIENDVILASVENQNNGIAYGFAHSVWNRYAPGLRQLPCKQEPCPETKRFYEALEKEMSSYFSKLPLLRYNVYHASGEKLITNEQFSADATLDRKSEVAFLSAQFGKAQSVLLTNYPIKGEERNVVRSFMPIFSSLPESPGKVEGVVELFFDITPMWRSPMIYQIIGMILMGGMFVALFAMVVFISRRAENIITKEHEVTLELTTAKASAEQENMEKSKFLANVSHELRTPLNAIIGFSEILKDEVMGPLGNEQYRDYVKDIHSSGVHLLSLINDILDFSKASADKLEVEFKETDVTKLLKSTLRLMAPRATESQVTLAEELPADHIVVNTDAKRLKQVVLNLLSNSVKFTPQGGKVTLYAEALHAEKQILIKVKDTGVGIAQKDIAKVMATFGQVENKLSRRYEGTGLGLPLSKKLVELLGGSFDIQSKEGMGTVVNITLPMK